jgi:hypothetical protein
MQLNSRYGVESAEKVLNPRLESNALMSDNFSLADCREEGVPSKRVSQDFYKLKLIGHQYMKTNPPTQIQNQLVCVVT